MDKYEEFKTSIPSEFKERLAAEFKAEEEARLIKEQYDLCFESELEHVMTAIKNGNVRCTNHTRNEYDYKCHTNLPLHEDYNGEIIALSRRFTYDSFDGVLPSEEVLIEASRQIKVSNITCTVCIDTVAYDYCTDSTHYILEFGNKNEQCVYPTTEELKQQYATRIISKENPWVRYEIERKYAKY